MNSKFNNQNEKFMLIITTFFVEIRTLKITIQIYLICNSCVVLLIFLDFQGYKHLSVIFILHLHFLKHEICKDDLLSLLFTLIDKSGLVILSSLKIKPTKIIMLTYCIIYLIMIIIRRFFSFI